MSFVKIAWRNMQERALASTLTGLSMALGVALMIVVIVIHAVAVEQFENDAQGYHLIVGGKGGALQLVLSTVFHLDKPLYPIPWEFYEKFVDGEFAAHTEVAVPYCLGDSYEGGGQLFRVVATTPDLFDKIAYGVNADGSEKTYKFADGNNFDAGHFFEAVVGASVARRCNLGVGDTFRPTHGFSEDGDKHDDFVVVGVLEPTGTANDRALFVNLEGFFLLEGHALAPPEGKESPPPVATSSADPNDPNRGFKPLSKSQREVTSILVKCSSEFAPMILDQQINKGSERIAQAVPPAAVITKLFDSIIGPVRVVLFALTVLIVIVAGISILVSIYNSMSERSHDIAVMRALGASRMAVMLIILLEAILLSVLAGLAGIVLGHGIVGVAGPIVESYSGVVLRFWQFQPEEKWLVLGLVLFAVLVGFLPALTAYRTDVGRTLGGAR